MTASIFFSAGEPSGDQHAARLVRHLFQLRPDLRCRGFGGSEMQAAGCVLDADIASKSVMGVVEALPLVAHYWQLAQSAGQMFRGGNVDATVLVDCPGFNWHIASRARRAGVPVLYYLPPQLWAWAPWRVRKVRKYVDRVLSVLPFEHQWYQEQGIDSLYVGHPFFDAVAESKLDPVVMQRLADLRGAGHRLVAVLPGSRTQEVHRNGPLLMEAVSRLAKLHPDVRFLVAAFRDAQCLWLRQMARQRYPDLKNIDFFVGKTSEIIEAAECGLMVSGSVSLEMMARGTPAVVVYHVGRMLYTLAKRMVRVPSMTLPNLIAGKTVYPEFASTGNPEPSIVGMVQQVDQMLRDAQYVDCLREELAVLRRQVAQPGATAAAARAVIEVLPGSERGRLRAA